MEQCVRPSDYRLLLSWPLHVRQCWFPVLLPELFRWMDERTNCRIDVAYVQVMVASPVVQPPQLRQETYNAFNLIVCFVPQMVEDDDDDDNERYHWECGSSACRYRYYIRQYPGHVNSGYKSYAVNGDLTEMLHRQNWTQVVERPFYNQPILSRKCTPSVLDRRERFKRLNFMIRHVGL